MTKRMIAGIAVLMIVLAGCGSSGSSGSEGAKKDTGASDSSGSSGSGGGDCDGYENGKDGVIRTFCGGPAKATVTVDGKDITFSGGECATTGEVLSVNIGVVTGSEFTGELPDYFGANIPTADGDFGGNGTVLTYSSGGESTSLRDVTGTHDGKSATFSGTPITGGATVTGSFTC
jgi:uncharacterized Zn-binding protein involved in type VI secretion